MTDTLIALACWLAATLVVGTVLGTAFRRARTRNLPAPEADIGPRGRSALAEMTGGIFDADGIPVAVTAPPGAPVPCFRCGGATECGTMVYVGHPLTGRLIHAVLCQDCYRMMWVDNAAFNPLFARRAAEEFGDHE